MTNFNKFGIKAGKILLHTGDEGIYFVASALDTVNSQQK